jgi:PadR family transcriptional regulator, regulatory protein AphA
MSERLTTTSYAILGQLALRERSTYELAEEMKRNMTFFWPRAESLIYSEVKRLSGLGLADARHEFTGRRKRTIYRVTDLGREALRTWLSTPPERTHLMSEILLRVMFARHGDRSQLVAAMAQELEHAREFVAVAERIQDEYLAGVAPFQEDLVIRSRMHVLLSEWALLLERWAAESIDYLNDLDALPAPEQERLALRAFASTPNDRRDELS